MLLSFWKRYVFCHQHFPRLFSVLHHETPILGSSKKHNSVITFKERSFNFFQKSEKYQEFCVPAYKLSSFNLEENKNTLSISETVSKLYADCESKLGKLKKKDIVNILDRCTGKQALILANSLLYMIGENFKKGVFYQHMLSKANNWIHTYSTHQELVLWAFVCSLEKSKQSSACIRSIYEHFKTDASSSFRLLSTFEMSILCNTWFSNNIIVSSKPMLRVIDQKLRDEIDLFPGVISQEAISLLKVLRNAGFGTEQLFESLLSSLSCPLAQNLNLAQVTHALALLADHRCLVNDQLIHNVENLVETNAKKPLQIPYTFLHPSRGTRVKDLTRFLWTASCLIPADVISRNQIAATIIDQVENGWNGGSFHLENDCHLLSDFFLSLACWQIYPQSLIEKIVNRNFVDVVLKQQQTVRQSRLALFLVAAQIEASHLKLEKTLLPAIMPGLPPYKAEKELIKRPHLARLAGVMDRRRNELNWENIQCCTTVPHLNFAGITFNYRREKIAVEVLDSYVCMRHSNRPERLLALKIRLSSQLGYRVIRLDVQQANQKQQEAQDGDSDQQMTMIRKCLENV